MSVLQAVGLGKQYNGIAALHDLHLSVEKGEIFCLLGQNGAGKTTTINLLLGFMEPTSGAVYVNGEQVLGGGASTRRFLAYIPEIVQLYSNLNGIENLDFFSRLAGFNYQKNELIALLTKAGLQQSAHQQPLSSYSKGMRQKVGIAIALSKKADAILMDEPTSGLDPKATAEFTAICKELAADGRTIFMATHDIFNAVNVGTRIGIMKQGSLVHTVDNNNITANQLQQLYLETIAI